MTGRARGQGTAGRRGWCAQVRARTTVEEVARALGLTRGHGGSWGPCPACREARRGSSDRRGPLGLSGRAGWRCHRCDASGDLVDLAGWVVKGARVRDLARDDLARVRGWFADQGWADPAAEGPPPVVPRPSGRPPLPGRAPLPSRDRPELDRPELAQLWGSARGVTLDLRVDGWLWRRGINPVLVSSLDLARALLPRTRCPTWAAYGREPWADTRPCLIPLYLPAEAAERGAAAEPAGVVARWVSSAEGGGPKQQPPRGCTQPGRVYASPLAREAAAGRGEPSWVWVVEGAPDYLSLAVDMARPADEGPAAVIGGDPSVADTWGAVAELLGLGGLASAGVVVATDPGEAGDRYAELVRRGLPREREVRRWSPPEEHPDYDVNTHLAEHLGEGWPGEDLCSDLAGELEAHSPNLRGRAHV